MGATCKDQLGGDRSLGHPWTWEEKVPEVNRILSLSRSGFPGDERDIAAGNTEVIQFTCGQAVQFRDSVTIAAPVVVRADQVHFTHLVSSCLFDHFSIMLLI